MLFLIANTKPFFHHREVLGIYNHDPSQYEARGTLDDTGRRLARDLHAAMTTIPAVNERLTTKELEGVATTLQHCILALERLPQAKMDLLEEQASSIRTKTTNALSANATRNQAGIPDKVTGVYYDPGLNTTGFGAYKVTISNGHAGYNKCFVCGPLGEADRHAHAKAVAWREAKQAEIDKDNAAKKKQTVKAARKKLKISKKIRAIASLEKVKARLQELDGSSSDSDSD